ncbi:MAG: hypothetical protein ACC634_11270, partial [Hyphomicrobiales bacterium]
KYRKDSGSTWMNVQGQVNRQHGVKTGYRTGWSIGMSYLEAPELKAGDRTRSSFACPLIRCYRYG